MKKLQHPVLCITRSGIPHHILNNLGTVQPMDLKAIDYNDLSFVNRSVVDAKAADLPDSFAIGMALPQILPYIVIVADDKVLTYDRKGNEERLHGLSSIGIGGHIDVLDVVPNNTVDGDQQFQHLPTIRGAAKREMIEEAGLDLYPTFKHALLSDNDEVGKVHLALISVFNINRFGYTQLDVTFKDELINARWSTLEELKASSDEFEDWSKIIIEKMEDGFIL